MPLNFLLLPSFSKWTEFHYQIRSSLICQLYCILLLCWFFPQFLADFAKPELSFTTHCQSSVFNWSFTFAQLSINFSGIVHNLKYPKEAMVSLNCMCLIWYGVSFLSARTTFIICFVILISIRSWNKTTKPPLFPWYTA